MVGNYYSEQMHGVVWERKRENGSCPVNKGGSAEVKVVRGGLRWVSTCQLGPWCLSVLGGCQGPCLPISGYMTLL